MKYGYARVSTKEQKEDRQIIALMESGVEEEHIFVDRQSGKDFERSAYRELVSILDKGDMLVIESIDRLGRNYNEILEQWRIMTKEIGVSITVLDMPILDTQICKDLTGTLIADIVLQLLSYVAQTEREFIRKRQAEGIAAAKARGVQFGRPPMKRPGSFEEVKSLWERGSISGREAARKLGISSRTFRFVHSEDAQEYSRLPCQMVLRLLNAADSQDVPDYSILTCQKD